MSRKIFFGAFCESHHYRPNLDWASERANHVPEPLGSTFMFTSRSAPSRTSTLSVLLRIPMPRTAGGQDGKTTTSCSSGLISRNNDSPPREQTKRRTSSSIVPKPRYSNAQYKQRKVLFKRARPSSHLLPSLASCCHSRFSLSSVSSLLSLLHSFFHPFFIPFFLLSPFSCFPFCRGFPLSSFSFVPVVFELRRLCDPFYIVPFPGSAPWVWMSSAQKHVLLAPLSILAI